MRFSFSYLSLLLAALFNLSGLRAMAQESERLTFGVISDTHFENGTGEGAMVKVPKALKNLTSQAKLDMLVDVGDIVDRGKPEEYEQLRSVFGNQSNFTLPVDRLLFVLGGHEYLGYQSDIPTGLRNFQEGMKSFNGGEPYPMNQYLVVKGFPFITVGMSHWYSSDTNSSSNGIAVYPVETQEWLSKRLAQATEECPGKPIFVFTHIPPRWTVYGSWPEYESGTAWCMKVLNPILNKYPQVVLFAGHSHYPIGDPRSIHQGTHPDSPHKNYYTVINTGSTTYSEVNPGAVAEGIHPNRYAYVTEGMIVSEQENGDIEIRRYDTYRNLEIGAGKRWVLKAPFDGSRFEYADVRDRDDNPLNVPLRDGLPAPVFTKSATIDVEASPSQAVLTFPQATDDECVFRYRIRAFKDRLCIYERYIFSQFYLNTDMPSTLKQSLSGLIPETEYSVEVVAYDSYDNTSSPLVRTFKTLAEGSAETIKPDGRWTFDNGDDLLKEETDRMTMRAITTNKNDIREFGSLKEAGITKARGPETDDGAIYLPKTTGLRVDRSSGAELTNRWTIMWYIKMPDANIYNCLLQTNKSNTNDGDLFIHENKIGMSAMGGYFGEIKDNTWYRIVMTNRGGDNYVYVDGKQVIKCGSDGRWELDPWGFYLFTDENNELSNTYVTEIAYWERSLSENEIRALSGLEPIKPEVEAPSISLKTSSVVVEDELDFSVTINANVAFSFKLPDWIEGVDIVPFAGERAYNFRAQPMTEKGSRSDNIIVQADGLAPLQVQVTQNYLGSEVPASTGMWTFDNPDDLLAGTGEAILRGAMRSQSGPKAVEDLETAGIVPVAGPSKDNGAITVPYDSYLQMAHNQKPLVQNTFSIMMDIRPKSLKGYNVLLQTDMKNAKDGVLFTKDTQIGISAGSLGYAGELELGKWHRIVFVVNNNCMTGVYIDGKKVSGTRSSYSRWALQELCYFFADENGEEGTIDIAELRYWNTILGSDQVKALGSVEITTDVNRMLMAPDSSQGGDKGLRGIYNLKGQRLSQPQKGVIIIDGKLYYIPF